MRSTMRIVVPGILAVLVPIAAVAGEPRRHDGGFFLRLAPGGGFSRSYIEEDGERFGFKGTSGSFDIAIGAMVTENFAVHGTLGGWSIVDPTIQFLDVEEQVDDASITMTMYGGGFTYYLGQSNTYITASAGAAMLNTEFLGESEDSETGFAVDAGLGKEWWVSDRWGLGVSATAGYHSIPPGDPEAPNFKGPSFAVRFSATFN